MMPSHDGIERRARRIAKQTADAAVMRATQTLRQFHRIGKSCSAGCRKAMEKALGEALENARGELVSLTAEGCRSADDVGGAAALVGRALEAAAGDFHSQLGSLLEQMEGWDGDAVRKLWTAELDEARAELETLVEARNGGVQPPPTDFVKEERLRRVAGLGATEAARCLAAQAPTAAAVFAGATLAAVLADRLDRPEAAATASIGSIPDLLRQAAAAGLIASEAVVAWTSRPLPVLAPSELPWLGEEVSPEDAGALFELLGEVCRQLAGNSSAEHRES